MQADILCKYTHSCTMHVDMWIHTLLTSTQLQTANSFNPSMLVFIHDQFFLQISHYASIVVSLHSPQSSMLENSEGWVAMVIGLEAARHYWMSS